MTLVLVLVIVLMLLFLASILHPPLRASGKLKLPAGPRTPIVSLGATHGLILASDGSLWSWGTDFLGWPVLGLGNINTQANLCRIGNDTNWISVAAGTSHNLAVKADGTLWAWGEDIRGQLGDGKKTKFQNQPVPSAPGNDWKEAAPGGTHTIALKNDGTLWSWGNNWAGQLGVGDSKDSVVPAQIGADHNWVRVWAGMLQNAALKSDGSLWVWGDNPANSNQLARSPKNLLSPTPFSPDTNWVNAAFGNQVLLAIKSDGTLWAWGRYASNCTGIADQPAIPTRVGTNNDWQSCTSAEWARELYAVLQKKDGSLWIMESSAASTNRLRFTKIDLQKDWVAFAGGGGGGEDPRFHMHDGVCGGTALTRDGEVWEWGRALGEFTPQHRFMQFTAQLAKKAHYEAHWGDPQPVMHDQPARIRNVSPKTPAGK